MTTGCRVPVKGYTAPSLHSSARQPALTSVYALHTLDFRGIRTTFGRASAERRQQQFASATAHRDHRSNGSSPRNDRYRSIARDGSDCYVSQCGHPLPESVPQPRQGQNVDAKRRRRLRRCGLRRHPLDLYPRTPGSAAADAGHRQPIERTSTCDHELRLLRLPPSHRRVPNRGRPRKDRW